MSTKTNFEEMERRAELKTKIVKKYFKELSGDEYDKTMMLIDNVCNLAQKNILLSLFEKLKKCGNLTLKEVWDEHEEEIKLIRTNQYINIIEQYFAEEIEQLETTHKEGGQK